jgi:hypothetical protein
MLCHFKSIIFIIAQIGVLKTSNITLQNQVDRTKIKEDNTTWAYILKSEILLMNYLGTPYCTKSQHV